MVITKLGKILVPIVLFIEHFTLLLGILKYSYMYTVNNMNFKTLILHSMPQVVLLCFHPLSCDITT